jgi:hypothetical protein
MRTNSTVSSDGSNFEYEDLSDDSSPREKEPLLKAFSSLGSDEEFAKYARKHLVSSVLGGALVAVAVTAFALWFPFALAPEAANKTYDWAFYSYDPQVSHFDNTIWTYGSDYALAVIMAVLSYSILQYSRSNVSDRLCIRSASLLVLYGVSTAAGGYCHQNYTTLESRNSLSFRLLWTLCVGTVTAAPCAMGMSGTEVIRKFQQQPKCHPLLRKLPLIPDNFWWSYGMCITAVCAWGGLSFQRPACDIFIAGITQIPSTFYLMVFFYLVQHHIKVSVSARIIGAVGFILNAPLLPMYPLLIQYTDWSLASVNTLLHSWLCVAWSMQGYSMLSMIKVLVSDRDEADIKKRR